MTNWIRAGVLAAAGTLAMTFAGSAFAAFNPRLTIGTTTQSGVSNLNIEGRIGTSDDHVARVQIFMPTGFALKSPAGGAQVGTVTATALSEQIGPGQQLPFKMTGKVTAIAATDPAVAWENANCDSGPHAAAWMVRVQGGGDSWNFPIFVNATSGSETSFGAYKLVACFKPISGPNMDQYGNKFVSMSLALKGFSSPTAAGQYRWRSLWTPFGANNSINQAGTVEAQSVVTMPTGVLSISSKRLGKQRYTINGKLLVSGEAFSGATVAIRHGATKGKLVTLGNAKTAATGAFQKPVTVKKPHWYQAGATLGGQDLGGTGCTASFGATVPCVSMTNAKVAVVSPYIRVRP